MNDQLLREINEDIRRDKVRSLWQRNKGALLALAIAVVVGTAGGQVYRSMKTKNDAVDTAGLLAGQELLESGKPAEAAARFKAAAAGARGEHKAMLHTWQARAELTAGNNDAARTTLATVIEEASKTGIWRDLACVWSAGLDGALPASCTTDGASPLLSLKRELAAADAIAASDYARARTEIDALRSASGATPQQQARAMQLELLLPPREPVPAAKE